MNLEQSLESDAYHERLRSTALIIEVKLEIAPQEDIREQVIVSRARFVKAASDDNFVQVCGVVLRNMAEIIQRIRKPEHFNFKGNALLEFLSQSLLQLSRVTWLCFVSQEQNEIIKLAHFASLVLTNA